MKIITIFPKCFAQQMFIQFAELQCLEPSGIPNADFAPKQVAYEVGASVEYTCADGYDIEGDNSIICQSSQKWTELASLCEGT